MRIGNNPLRFKPAPYEFKPVVCLVVVHLPDDDDTGYHAHRMDVVKTCLTTMRNGAKRDHTFFVWDNGSSIWFREWLEFEFKPDMLMLSPNIGKNPARASAIQMLPLGTIVAYSDDDIFYYDNWLTPQIDLLNHFPNVACVSGYPVRTQFRWGVENTLKWARENAKVKQGRFIPTEWEKDFCVSIERDWQYHLDYTEKDIDFKIIYEGKEAYATAHHCQFIGYAVNILPALHHDNLAMSDEKRFDTEMDRHGLRLCTTQRYARHIGNVLDDSFKELLNAASLQEQV
jgi:hypothetical protein